MDFICNDINGPSKWYYEDGKYHRVMPDGSLRYTLEGKLLANPADIEAQGKAPQASTIAVFNHWQKVKDNANPDQ